MQLVLVMFRAEGERRSFSVTRDVTIIGRREDCDLRIPVSEVSRKHCRVIKDGDEVRVEDLGSSNGTYHNGQRIQGSVAVHPGDSVEVGPVVFVVQVDGTPADDELAPFTDRAAAAVTSEAATPEDSVFDDLAAPTPMANEDSFAAPGVDAEAAPIDLEESDVGGAIPMAMDDESPTIDIDLSDDHGGGHEGHALSEDELLMDMNGNKDHDKH